MLPTTSFEDRLGTNYVPTQDETIAIRELINAIEPQIDSLDAEIEALKQRRAIYASFVADHRALISPIRHMPPDILRNIFSHCVPYGNPEMLMQTFEAPLLLTQICRHWRDLAITTPTLWSTIFLRIPMLPRGRAYPSILPREIMDVQIDIEAADTSEALFAALTDTWRRKMENVVSLTSMWLSRAEACPLTVLFRDIDAIHPSGPHVSDEGFTHEPVKRLTTLLCARSSQWAQLDLRVSESSSSEDAFLSLSPSHTPHLRSIHVQWAPRQSMFGFTTHQGQQTPDPALKSSLHLLKSKHLRHLFIDNFSGNFKNIPAAWSSLTELSFIGAHTLFSGALTGFTPSVALVLLQECPNLVRCELHISEYAPTINVNTDHHTGALSKRVHLPHLQRFVVSEYKDGPSLTLLDSLELPVLNSMSLSVTLPHVTPHESVPPLSLQPLLAASGHSIQHLEFGAISITVADIVASLKLAVGVTELTINMSNVVPPGGIRLFLPGPGDTHSLPLPFYRDELLVRLAPPNALAAETIICPSLAVLNLTLADTSDITTKSLRNLVAHRGFVECHSTNTPSHRQGLTHAPLERVSVRFSMPSVIMGDPRSHSGGKMPVFPKRWREDQVNSGFSRRVIKVERRKAITHAGMNPMIEFDRRPFEPYWDFEANRYEQCCL